MFYNILDKRRLGILPLFRSFKNKFYLAGGTALSEFYFHHRISEDLDFFTEEELDIKELERFINLIGKKIVILNNKELIRIANLTD